MSLITTLLSLVITVAGYFSPWFPDQILSAGIFALSGALTNWLAVHMLFEKVPLVYGSGVIPLRFEDMKKGIKNLIMSEFFRQENVVRMLDEAAQEFPTSPISGKIAKAVNYDAAFDGMKGMIRESGFGSVLGMFGGMEALERYRPRFKEKMQTVVQEQISSPEFAQKIQGQITEKASIEAILTWLERLIDERLDELTPPMVKQIIQDMIRDHLGWLVVWGGVFGGLIGLAFSFLP